MKILPFGKYLGDRIDVFMKKNPQYLYWLIQQPWLKERHKTLYLEIVELLGISEEVEIPRSIEMIKERVTEALLARGFSKGESEQKINRLIQYTGKKEEP